MSVKIERSAIKAALHNMLSCRCPVTPEAEAAMIGAYRAQAGEELLGLEAILKAAEVNPVKTPLYSLYEFCRNQQTDPAEFVIRLDDVLRFLGTAHHFASVLSGIDPLVVSHTASHVVSHMLLPATLTEEGALLHALVGIAEKKVIMKNLVLPPEVEFTRDQPYAVHMGAVITPISGEQALMMKKHLMMIPEFNSLLSELDTVDFRDFQRFGDYHQMIGIRYDRNYPTQSC